MIGQGPMKHALEPTANPAWVVDADGYDELREGSLEFALRDQQRISGRKGHTSD